MISKKLKVLKRLTALLEGINPTWLDLPSDMAGEVCPFDMRGKVFRGRLEFGDDVKGDFLAVLEAPRQLDPFYAGESSLTTEDGWGLLVQGFAREDRNNPLDPAYELLAWTQMRLARITQTKKHGQRGGEYPDTWRLGDLVTDVRYQIPIVRPGKDAVSDTAYFYLPISVGVVTELTMPFVPED